MSKPPRRIKKGERIRPVGMPRTGGRTKGTPNKNTVELRALAGKYGPEVIAEFVSMFRQSPDEDVKIRVGQELLNRGFGRPAQAIHHSDNEGGPLDLGSMNDEQLARLEERIIASIATSSGAVGD